MICGVIFRDSEWESLLFLGNKNCKGKNLKVLNRKERRGRKERLKAKKVKKGRS
jgi:hypothetical protein